MSTSVKQIGKTMKRAENVELVSFPYLEWSIRNVLLGNPLLAALPVGIPRVAAELWGHFAIG